MNETRKLFQEWQQKAAKDFLMVKILLKSNSAPRDGIAYHCQQAIEKYLKSFLCIQGETIPRIHDLEILRQLCLKINNGFQILAKDTLLDITAYAVDTRYPGNCYVPTKREINIYVNMVKQVKQVVEKLTK